MNTAAVKAGEVAQEVSACVLIPSYNHVTALERLLPRVLETGMTVLVVNDGSTDGTSDMLRSLSGRVSNLAVIDSIANRGKGAAVTAGFHYAKSLGFTHAVQIDADGQHPVDSIETFVRAAHENPKALILGSPEFDSSAPRVRVWGRKITTLLVWMQTRGRFIEDALCGFRMYPLGAACALLHDRSVGERMDFDPEILVRLVWQGTPIVNIAVPVCYPIDGVSHFRYIKDNLLITSLHLRLLIESLFWKPSVTND